MKILLVISGIGKHDYGLNTLKEHPVWTTIDRAYDEVIEIRYQDIMDKHSLLFKTALDPIRLVFSPDGWNAEQHVRTIIEEYAREHVVDIMAHSLGAWLCLKNSAKIRKLFLLASPIGWGTWLLRKVVHFNIGKPKLKVEDIFYFFSNHDIVCKKFIMPKVSQDRIEIYNTGKTHNMNDYLDYIYYLHNIFK